MFYLLGFAFALTLVLAIGFLLAVFLFGQKRAGESRKKLYTYGGKPVVLHTSYNKEEVGNNKAREELTKTNTAVGDLTSTQRAWVEMFQRSEQIMEESLEIAKQTKNEITRASRLNVAKQNLERLVELTRNEDCPLKLRNSDEIWAEYYRISGSAGVASWENDKPVDLNHFIGRPWGEIVSEMTGGANLVDGQQTWELADEFKHDLPKMLECCYAELRTMEQAGLIPAPFYFERAAILLRKAKQHESEVKLLDLYVSAISAWNQANGNAKPMGAGKRHEKILQRYEKAKQLASKQRALPDALR